MGKYSFPKYSISQCSSRYQLAKLDHGPLELFYPSHLIKALRWVTLHAIIGIKPIIVNIVIARKNEPVRRSCPSR